LSGIGVQQVLLIVVGMRQRVLVRQPVILPDQPRQALRHRLQQRRFVSELPMKGINFLNKMA
jgi:hypothetical protein